MTRTLTKVFGVVLALAAGLLLGSVVPAGAGGYERGKSAATEMAPTYEYKVNVNSASVEELAAVEGIGESLAKSIVAYREENGPFATWDDLRKVKGLGEQELSAFRDRVTLE